jgi:hypothetical protein
MIERIKSITNDLRNYLRFRERPYHPRKYENPKTLDESYPTAWKGIEKIIRDIILRFELNQEKCLEIGVEYGFSAFAFSNYFKNVIGVDTFIGDLHSTIRKDFFDITKKNLEANSNITLVRSDYKDYIKHCDEQFDLIHIDIIHTYEDTYNCGIWAVAHAKCTLFHDTESFQEVKRAVSDIAKHSGKKFYNFKDFHGLGIVV